jgi:hypothetical protein
MTRKDGCSLNKSALPRHPRAIKVNRLPLWIMRKYLPNILLVLFLLSGLLVYGNSAKRITTVSSDQSLVTGAYSPTTIDRSGEIELTFTHSPGNNSQHIAIKKIPGQGNMADMPAFTLHKTVLFSHTSLAERRTPLHLQMIFPFHYFP